MATTESLKRSGLLKFWKTTVPTGENGDPILLTWFPISLSLLVSTSSGKWQFSLSSPEEVKAGTATWHDWQPGAVSANTASWLQGPVTAVRCVSASGQVIGEVVAYQSK